MPSVPSTVTRELDFSPWKGTAESREARLSKVSGIVSRPTPVNRRRSVNRESANGRSCERRWPDLREFRRRIVPPIQSTIHPWCPSPPAVLTPHHHTGDRILPFNLSFPRDRFIDRRGSGRGSGGNGARDVISDYSTCRRYSKSGVPSYIII